MITDMQRGAFKRAINRFERAVENYAFIGTIPSDSDEAFGRARELIEHEYRRSRECLDNLIKRYLP